MAKKTVRRRKKPTTAIGLAPAEMADRPPHDVEDLCGAIEKDGGKVLAPYRDPLGGKWFILAALPIEQVEPTPYQRGLSDSHVKRLANVIEKTGRFLDPVITLRVGPGKYQTPNGHHRTSALKLLGARTVTALVVTEPEIARLILALNCEKAHNLREKAKEVILLARHLSDLPGKESDFVLEFEEAAFLTLGMCYEERPRFAGGAYHPLLKRADQFLEKPLAKALDVRKAHATSLLEIDEKVSEIVAKLKERGLESPYLKTFVVARINPIRFLKGDPPPLEDVLEKMGASARKFDAGKISVKDVARSGGAAPDEPAGD